MRHCLWSSTRRQVTLYHDGHGRRVALLEVPDHRTARDLRPDDSGEPYETCGGDTVAVLADLAGHGPGGARTRSAHAPAASSGSPIKVGVISARAVEFGTNIAVPAEKVVDAWEKSYNANGGVNGRPSTERPRRHEHAQELRHPRATHISDGVDVILDIAALSARPQAQAVDAAKIP